MLRVRPMIGVYGQSMAQSWLHSKEEEHLWTMLFWPPRKKYTAKLAATLSTSYYKMGLDGLNFAQTKIENHPFPSPSWTLRNLRTICYFRIASADRIHSWMTSPKHRSLLLMVYLPWPKDQHWKMYHPQFSDLSKIEGEGGRSRRESKSRWERCPWPQRQARPKRWRHLICRLSTHPRVGRLEELGWKSHGGGGGAFKILEFPRSQT